MIRFRGDGVDHRRNEIETADANFIGLYLNKPGRRGRNPFIL